jgi:hypothetical protein
MLPTFSTKPVNRYFFIGWDELIVMQTIKIAALALTVLVILNLILFAFGRINPLLFWLILAIIGLAAYKILPKFKK